MDYNKITKTMYEMADSRRKVGKLNFQEKDLHTLFEVVDQVNALGWEDRRIGDVLLDEVEIPSFLRDFIYPKKVTLTFDWMAPDLVVRPAKKPDYKYDYAKIRNIAYKVAGAFKQEPSFFKASDRKEVLFSDVFMSLSGKVQLKDANFKVPVPLVPSLKGMVDSDFELANWSNMTEIEVVSKFLAYKFNF